MNKTKNRLKSIEQKCVAYETRAKYYVMYLNRNLKLHWKRYKIFTFLVFSLSFFFCVCEKNKKYGKTEIRSFSLFPLFGFFVLFVCLLDNVTHQVSCFSNHS